MVNLTLEEQEKMVGIESQLTVINEELGKAKGMNRRSLTEHYADKMLDLFNELKEYRKLTGKERLALKLVSMYVNKNSRSNSKKIKRARNKLKQLDNEKNLGLKFDKE